MGILLVDTGIKVKLEPWWNCSPSGPMAKRGRRPPEWNILNPGAFPESSPSSYSPEDLVRRSAAAAIFITTLNVTYGGDSYNGSIHDGFVGGRRNENSGK